MSTVPDPKRRALVLAAVTLACAGTTAACGSDDDGSDRSSQGESYRIGVVLPGGGNPYFGAMKRGAEKADANLDDVEIEFGNGPSDLNVPETVAAIETLLTKEVDGLALVGYDPGLAPVLEGALNDGTPIVFMDGDVPDLAEKTPLVATASREAGRKAGEFIAKTLGGEGKVGLLVGLPGVPVSLERTAGAEQVLKGTNIEIVAKLPSECKRDRGVSATEDMLTAHPDIDLIYAACADPILGAIQALKSAGKTGQVKLVGFDAQPEEITAIKAGDETASIQQFPDRMGTLGVRTVRKWLKTGKVPGDVDSGVRVVTKDNVDSVK